MPREVDSVSDATLRLILTPGLGPATLRRLREHFSDDERIVAAGVRELEQVHGIGEKNARSLRRAIDAAEPEAERELMTESRCDLVLLGDADYPPLLASIDDPPPALWVLGTLDAALQPSLAIVGSRRCTGYGREQAGRFASLLAQSGLTIISGGALGVDAAAHHGALRVNNRTIAVLGCGLARCYPPQHEELFAQIVERGGAIVSELPMRSEPRGQNFPRRNRIISGMSLGVLVIEASKRSGALITARLAADDQGREVMALPGRVDSPASAGCLKLIRDGAAALVRDHVDVLEQLESSPNLLRGALSLVGAEADGAQPPSLFDGNLNDVQQAVVDILKDAGQMLQVDQLAARAQLPMSQLLAELTMLEIRGRVKKDHQGVRLREQS